MSTYLVIETRKQAMVPTKTKISTILHLARASNHNRILPRLVTETIFGGVNHNTKEMIDLEVIDKS